MMNPLASKIRNKTVNFPTTDDEFRLGNNKMRENAIGGVGGGGIGESESKETKAELMKLKNELLKYLEKTASKLQTTQGKYTASAYDEFMYEVVHTLTLMLQFGLFNEHSGLTQQRTKEKNIIFRYFANARASKEQTEVSELERIIKALAFLLEYDKQYFTETDSIGLKRKYKDHMKARLDNMYAKMIKQTKTITRVLATRIAEETRVIGFAITSNSEKEVEE